MALYQFMCSRCLHKFNRTYKFSEDKKPICPACECNKVYRVFDSTPFIFKTKGFYKTDK